MSVSPRSTFEQCALASGLLLPQQLDEARAALRGADSQSAFQGAATDQELADRLVEMGLLNAWQAKQLLDGRTKFTLGPYTAIDSLGQGGMGHVYKALDLLGRPVAIKVLPRDKSTPEAVASFQREIQALASLSHPKLVRALDAGCDHNVYYLITEYVPGADLRKLVRRGGPLSMESAAAIISQVAEGLQHAHAQGIIHRDVKPGNVLVTPEGEAKLSDLGLAGPRWGSFDQDPRHGKIVGTADYLSPDHIQTPWNPTPAWDIYSLGCTLYYAVSGKVPFPGGTTADKARAHCDLRPLDPRRLNHHLSDPFVDVLADMMAKDPVQRIQSAAEVIERLAPWAREASGIRQSLLTAAVAQPSPADGPPSPPPSPPPPTPPVPGAGPPGSMLPSSRSGIVMPAIPPPLPARRSATPPGAAAAQPAVPPVERLRDTVAEAPASADGSSGSNGSLSLIVAMNRRMPVGWLLVLVLTPVALALLAILIGWICDVMF